ncbi:hypothetical protein E2C01_081334 [Portunus trituberculatus]|uniref:Uncharacterized protein n=1 Tax=Portunus trituberculatus TaxID=210409 RepID=A0A5B7J212_PORTR|nr:hypothetical protein [Portunus trituberculatus]
MHQSVRIRRDTTFHRPPPTVPGPAQPVLPYTRRGGMQGLWLLNRVGLLILSNECRTIITRQSKSSWLFLRALYVGHFLTTWLSYNHNDNSRDGSIVKAFAHLTLLFSSRLLHSRMF